MSKVYLYKDFSESFGRSLLVWTETESKERQKGRMRFLKRRSVGSASSQSSHQDAFYSSGHRELFELKASKCLDQQTGTLIDDPAGSETSDLMAVVLEEKYEP